MLNSMVRGAGKGRQQGKGAWCRVRRGKGKGVMQSVRLTHQSVEGMHNSDTPVSSVPQLEAATENTETDHLSHAGPGA